MRRRASTRACMLDRIPVMDLYGPLLAKALFPAFEAARGRPTVPLLRVPARDRAVVDRAAARPPGRACCAGWCATRTATPRTTARCSTTAGCAPRTSSRVDDLQQLPLLDRDTVRATLDARTAERAAALGDQEVDERHHRASRSSSGTTPSRGTGAMRRAGAATAGPATASACARCTTGAPGRRRTSWVKRRKIALDRALKRDLYVDCTPRSDEALRGRGRRSCASSSRR